MTSLAHSVPDARGRFGRFGGRYVPETLVPALEELAAAYDAARADPAFRAELDALRAQLSAHPADAPLHVRLAAALLAQREVLAASESVARALYLDPLDEDALMLAARIADERGATADADRYRQRALRAHLARMQRDGGA